MPKKGDVCIFGSCVSREIFNYYPSNQLLVGEYIHKCSPLFVDKWKNVEDIVQDDVKLDHNFVKRSVCTLLNGKAWDRLISNWSDWIIIDNHYFVQKLFQLSNGTEKRIIQIPSEIQYEIKRIVNSNVKYRNVTVEEVDASPNYPLLIKKLSKELQKWAGKIIVVDAPRANYQITNKGKMIKVNQEDDYLRIYATKLLVNELDCFYITHPIELYSDYYKHDDYSRVHYSRESYEYLSTMVWTIIKKQHLDHSIIQKAVVNYQFEMNMKIHKEFLSKSEALEELVSYIKKNDYGMIELLSNSIYDKWNSVEGFQISIDYYIGQKNEKCNKLAVNEIKKMYYVCNGIDANYYNYLWMIDTDESSNLLVEIASDQISNNDGQSMYWMAKLYKEGKGVPKDLEKAAYWMRKAVDLNTKWAVYGLYDILWRINTINSQSELFRIITEKTSSGDKHSIYWMAKLYKEGKGVPKDLEKAAYWMRKAVDLNTKWAVYGLYDVLLEIDSKESLKEMIELATPLAEAGDGEMQGRLGRAYRDGKGVPKDTDLAEYWMKKAADQNIKWALKDLSDMLNQFPS